MSTGRNPSWGPRNPRVRHLVRLFTNWVTFPATQVPSSDPNTLDDYKEDLGGWTPSITFATPGDLSVSYADRIGHAWKVGNRVTVDFIIKTSAFTHATAAGDLQITGLDYAITSSSQYQAQGALQFSGITKAGYTNFVCRAFSSRTYLDVVASGSGVGTNAVGAADMPGGGSIELNGTISYFAAA